MAKKRTKKQKTRATYHYAYPAGRSFVGLAQAGSGSDNSEVVEKTNISGMYQYDPKYLQGDLKKTLIITLIMIGLEIGIYYWIA